MDYQRATASVPEQIKSFKFLEFFRDGGRNIFAVNADMYDAHEADYIFTKFLKGKGIELPYGSTIKVVKGSVSYSSGTDEFGNSRSGWSINVLDGADIRSNERKEQDCTFPAWLYSEY